MGAMTTPATDRPDMPEGYGVPESQVGLLDWFAVESRLVDALNYWMATTRPDGRPHVVPRWGVWMDGGLYYDGSPATRHARNLSDNQSCSLHLESGSEVVIVEGASGPTESPGLELGGRLSAEFIRKYGESGYEPSPDSWEGEMAGGLCRFEPTAALAWFAFPTDVTRFRF